MQNCRIAGLLAACLCLLLVQNLSGDGFPVQYGARLRISSRSELQQRLREPFTAGTAHPAGVSNCMQMLRRRGSSTGQKQTGRDTQAMRSTMAECLVLRELERAAPARNSHVRDLIWDEHVLPLLPPELAIGVSNEAEQAAHNAALRGQAWSDFDPSLVASAKGTDQIVVTGKGFREQLILWGRGDFNHDGNDDLLVQSLDTLTGGTYRNTRLFVLTRRTANGKLSLVRSLL